jgi:hypothetical protein
LKQRFERADFVCDVEGHPENASFEQIKQRPNFKFLAAQKILGFSQDRFARQQRRPETGHLLARPVMVFCILNQEGDQRTGIRENDAIHFPKSSMYFGFVARSRGPRSEPARSRARS